MEKNPSFKIGRIFAKKIKILKGSRYFFSLRKKSALMKLHSLFFLKQKNHEFSSIVKNFFLRKKIHLQLKKKRKSPKVEGTFFETTSEANCPEKPLANECRKRVYLTTIPLPYHRGRNPVWSIMFQSKFI